MIYILVMLIVLVSCSENNEPIIANNKLIRNVIKDSVAEALYQAGRTLIITNYASFHMIDKIRFGSATQCVEEVCKPKNYCTHGSTKFNGDDC